MEPTLTNTTTDSSGGLWAAFVAAAAELSEPVKQATAEVTTRTGSSFRYSYLTLPQLSDLVRAVFARHGLAFTQQVTTPEPGQVTVTTTLVHTSGARWTCDPLALRPASTAPQDVGSVMTYGRRYQLAALVGLSGADDDDAASQQPTRTSTPSRAARPPAVVTAAEVPNTPPPGTGRGGRAPSDKQVRFLHRLLGQHGYNSRESVLAWCTAEIGREIGSSSDLDAAEVSQLIDRLKGTPPAERVGPGPDGQPPEDPWADSEPDWPDVAEVGATP